MTLFLAAALILSPGSCYQKLDIFGDPVNDDVCKVIKSKAEFLKVSCSYNGNYSKPWDIIRVKSLTGVTIIGNEFVPEYVNVPCNERKKID
jgi:hypothetical protein